MGIAATTLSLTEWEHSPNAMAVATICGEAGSLFALTALVFSSNQSRGDPIFSLLTCVCAVVGTVCVVVATQELKVTLLASAVYVSLTVCAIVLRSKVSLLESLTGVSTFDDQQ